MIYQCSIFSYHHTRNRGKVNKTILLIISSFKEIDNRLTFREKGEKRFYIREQNNSIKKIKYKEKCCPFVTVYDQYITSLYFQLITN